MAPLMNLPNIVQIVQMLSKQAEMEFRWPLLHLPHLHLFVRISS